MLRTGSGARHDHTLAVKWYRKSADQRFPEAQHRLGRMYAHGHGVPEDDAKAVEWLTRAAKQEDAEVQYRLGHMYYMGDGLPRDGREAGKWYRKAAEKGHAEAQYEWGRMKYWGNAEEAVEWYRKAAKQGSSGAQLHLAEMYEKGKGVRKNNIEAYAWLNLYMAKYRSAGVEFHPYLQFLQTKIQSSMTQAQIAEAQARSLELADSITSKREFTRNWSLYDYKRADTP